MRPFKNYDQGESPDHNLPEREEFLMTELIDNISQIQTTIAPHVDRYEASQRADKCQDAVSIYAARTSVALTELNSIVRSHQQTKSINPELDDETFAKAEEAIDTIRHTHLKFQQRSQLIPRCSFVDFGLESAFQKGQSWLLSASRGTDYADALLWQFTNQDTVRDGPGVSCEESGSRQLWPPTARTMKQTREYLKPSTKWFGKREVQFEQCTHTPEELKEIHRNWAVERLETGRMDGWESDIISRAIERSGGTVPAMNTDVETWDATVAVEEGPFAVGSDDGEQEEEVVVSGPFRLRGL